MSQKETLPLNRTLRHEEVKEVQNEQQKLEWKIQQQKAERSDRYRRLTKRRHKPESENNVQIKIAKKESEKETVYLGKKM
ncbi:hypothetical protein MAR_033412 [Mya arenaria]|uniref:Uncharacterized protein n=1 Tax=Mya arenaria TaxID=6604 RepID=A0ABY7G9R4_MYAAR|nr:hypothetical protein MAR_033412 [Mya arenaria]